MTTHIKMPDITPIIRYLADGIETVFIYPFPIFASEDLYVYLDGARQDYGFTVTNEGVTAGGSVIFATAPAKGVAVTLERVLPLERVTDFIEGGDFSARALNNELDYLTAGMQQISRAQGQMLRYQDHEVPASVTLPERAMRANKALGFDAAGNPVALSLGGLAGDGSAGGGEGGSPDFTADGFGAIARDIAGKLSDHISVRDYGAIGDGITDDTLSFQKALAAHDAVFVPEGVYLVTNTIVVGERKTLYGSGEKSVIRCNSNLFPALELPHGYARIATMRIEYGQNAILLRGRQGPCVQNNITDITCWGQDSAIVLDGYMDSNKPCYWNNFSRVLAAQPRVNGFHLVKTGAGDTPNANRFHMCRVYSLGADMTGSGFYVEHGQLNNSFTDCEANVKGTAQACFRMGAGSDKTLLLNPYAESTDLVPNILLDDGSIGTSIINLTAQSDGAAIHDLSGGHYDALNAGYPYKNRLGRSTVSDLNATLMRYDTEYIDQSGSVTLDLSHSIHLVSAFAGDLDVILPTASMAAGVTMTIKKVDATPHVITINEQGGAGPDKSTVKLGGEHDYVCVLSNGATWHIVSSNRMAGNTRYFDGAGIYDIDMAVDVYLLSAFSGPLTARLPPANAAEAIGRQVTIKKTDASSNIITISEQGGAGPDQHTQSLPAHYDAMSVVSNGAEWYIVSRF